MVAEPPGGLSKYTPGEKGPWLQRKRPSFHAGTVIHPPLRLTAQPVAGMREEQSQTERSLVVARLWSQLTGAAKSVVRFLDPDKYDGEQGLSRFLEVLRSSPLQNLPVPDSFTRLDKWSNLRRRDKESIAELLIREEELYVELQQALTRARRDKQPDRPACPQCLRVLLPWGKVHHLLRLGAQLQQPGDQREMSPPMRRKNM